MFPDPNREDLNCGLKSSCFWYTATTMDWDIRGDALSPEDWADAVETRLFDKSRRPLETACRAILQYPDSALLLEFASFAAIVEEQPELALRYLKKLDRSYFPTPRNIACKAIALAQLGKWPFAQSLLESVGVSEKHFLVVFPEGMDSKWTQKWVHAILRWKPLPRISDVTLTEICVFRPICYSSTCTLIPISIS